MFAVKSQPEEVFGLPNIKSAKKRVQLAEVRNARNKADKSALKTALKKFEAAAAEGNRTEAEGAYKVAVKIVDKSAAKGLLHKNNAAHKKSAMTTEAQQHWLIEPNSERRPRGRLFLSADQKTAFGAAYLQFVHTVFKF